MQGYDADLNVYSYLFAAYYIVVTFSKEGYGDVYPISQRETEFTAGFIFASMILFSIISGKINSAYHVNLKTNEMTLINQKEEKLDELILNL